MKGSCLCGAVRFELTGPFLRAGHCHCSRCRKHSGAFGGSQGRVPELIFDKLPNTPNRTAPLGLIARIVTGGFTGACVSLGGGKSALVGAALGVIGGIVGCFAGYHARAWLVRHLRQPDFNIALLEDLVAIGGSLFIVSRF